MFTGFPSYGRYRTLALHDPLLRGEDVFALQTGLHGCGFDPGSPDGILGKDTAAAIRSFQRATHLTLDGAAGGQTQKALALVLAGGATLKYALPSGALRGQLEHESGFRVGNYSAQRADGSYDAGVAQRNTAHTPAKDGFTVPASIDALGKLIRAHYVLFDGVPTRRRWSLAQGAWNAPAYACWLANQAGATVSRSLTLQPGPTARQTFEQYIASVTAYLSV